MARENQRQASQLQSLSSGGHERTVGIADEAQQRKLRAAIEATAAAEAAAAAQRADREAKLRSVVVKKEDVDAVAAAFDIPRAAADVQLRLHAGDVAATMRALIG